MHLSILINCTIFNILLIFHLNHLVFKRYGEVSSSIKLKVRLPIVDVDDCRTAYSSYNLNIGPGQVCAGGMKAKDSCLGDSGEPLFHIFSFFFAHLFVQQTKTKTYIYIQCSRRTSNVFRSAKSLVDCIRHC